MNGKTIALDNFSCPLTPYADHFHHSGQKLQFRFSVISNISKYVHNTSLWCKTYYNKYSINKNFKLYKKNF